MLVTKTSPDVSVYFVSAIIPFRYYEIKMFRTRAQNYHCFRSQKASGWHIQSVTQHKTLLRKKRTLLDKITSLQKYKQERLKQGLKQTSFVCSSLKINKQVNELCEGKLEKKTTKTKTTTTKTEREKEFWTQILDSLHWPGIEPGPPAWQARILPLNHQCLSMAFPLY